MNTQIIRNAQAKSLIEHAAEIRRLGKRAVADVVEIGRRLVECKKLCGHRNWLPWLDREFGWTEQTALNFIRVHELAKSKNFLDLSIPVSGLYLLAAPSTPEEARDEIIDRASSGEALSTGTIKDVINRHKPPSKDPHIDAVFARALARSEATKLRPASAKPCSL